jgi:maltooligosyltrehalose trehalohydrolase
LFAENEFQDVRHLAPVSAGGFALDGLWNDDFHHSARVAATGHAEGYFSDYTGSAQELLSAATRGYLYQGQWHPRQKKRRGTDCRAFPAATRVNFLENHDQVANSSLGLRPQQLTSPGRWRALTTLLLLSPGTPMLFMGQEFAATSPFLYFADLEAWLADLVRDGRWDFLCQFTRAADAHIKAVLPSPAEVATADSCRLDWNEAASRQQWVSLHKDLLALRKKDRTFAAQDSDLIAGAVIEREAFLLRWMGGADGDRLLLVNLGRDMHWRPLAEPLTAPPPGSEWQVLWSSDDQKYGGLGVAGFTEKDWFVPGHAATVLCAVTAD